METIPRTRYAKTVDGVHIAYATLGDGPPDIVYIPGFVTHLELFWEIPFEARFVRRMAGWGRLILFDKRGTGLSDRTSPLVDLDTRADDLRAVLDAVESERAVLIGDSEGGALAAFFAATYPERVTALAWYHASSRNAWAADYPWGWTPEAHQHEVDLIERSWGSEDWARGFAENEMASIVNEPALIAQLARWLRFSASPAEAIAFERMWYETDVRAVLPTIQVPTLIVNREHLEGPGWITYASDLIPGAKLIRLPPGDPHAVLDRHQDEVLDPMEAFLTSVRRDEIEFDRVLATVMFTDIVNSTAKLTSLGDQEWRDLIKRHHQVVRGLLTRYRGKEIDVAGDGFFATFEGPARAVRCAEAITDAVRPLGIEVRVGVHTGEVELDGESVRGIAVVIGARIGAMAGPSEVLVSQTVKDLVAGSGLVFVDRGERELKGVADRWQLFSVVSEQA
jgi:class 3 adenylate cyclase